MTYEEARKKIQEHFITYANISSTKVAYDNVEFDAPDNENWLRFSILNVGSSYKSIGLNKISRRRGLVFMQIFSKKGSTTLESEQLLDKIVAPFETKLLQNITFESPEVLENKINDNWYIINVSIPFFYDKIVITT